MPRNLIQIHRNAITALAEEYSLLEDEPFQFATAPLDYLQRTIKNDNNIFCLALLLFTLLVSLPLLIVLLFKSERKQANVQFQL